MNKVTDELLRLISDYDGSFDGAYNIREDGQCDSRRSTEHIRIESKITEPGIDIYISAEAQNETVFIPACVSHSGVDDLVYNDFHIEAGANVTIVAGCGVHNDGHEDSMHNGIHRFFLGKDSYVLYKEKHIGTGDGSGARRINPVTDAYLEDGAVLEMDTIQLSGVDTTDRKTTAKLGARARFIVRERLMTDGVETAETDFTVTLDGPDSGVDLVSRSVARGTSRQHYRSTIIGNNRCTGHSECDAILSEQGTVTALPALEANHIDAQLVHEAAIGKIAGEQILKLRTLGLTEEQAEERIIEGFLK